MAECKIRKVSAVLGWFIQIWKCETHGTQFWDEVFLPWSKPKRCPQHSAPEKGRDKWSERERQRSFVEQKLEAQPEKPREESRKIQKPLDK